MREPILRLLKNYVNRLIEAVAGIGLYSEAVEDIEKQKANILPVYNEFVEEIKDQESWKKLSMQEQQALGQNEINYKHLIREMDNAMSHLIKQKWTSNIRSVLFYLDDVKLQIDDALADKLSDIGKQVKPQNLIPKKFEKADYTGRISIVQIAINIVRETVIDEGVFEGASDAVSDAVNEGVNVKIFKFNVRSGIGKAFLLLQREMEDIEINGMPELHQFEIPELVVPEVPDAPDKKPPEQMELPLEPKLEVVK